MRHFEQNAKEWYGPWWRWLIVAWVVWWGVLYGKMVVERRGGKVREAIVRWTYRSHRVEESVRPKAHPMVYTAGRFQQSNPSTVGERARRNRSIRTDQPRVGSGNETTPCTSSGWR
jgi:hypothetical protein